MTFAIIHTIVIAISITITVTVTVTALSISLLRLPMILIKKYRLILRSTILFLQYLFKFSLQFQ